MKFSNSKSEEVHELCNSKSDEVFYDELTNNGSQGLHDLSNRRPEEAEYVDLTASNEVIDGLTNRIKKSQLVEDVKEVCTIGSYYKR